jgi:hypothetical protein
MKVRLGQHSLPGERDEQAERQNGTKPLVHSKPGQAVTQRALSRNCAMQRYDRLLRYTSRGRDFVQVSPASSRSVKAACRA